MEAEREILSLLPRAKKLKYDHNRRTISYGNPPPPPQAPDRGVIPSFEKSWKVVAEKLHFPDASGYRQTEESGPHPQRLTHCCQAWLEKCGVLYVLEKWKAEASIARRCLLSDEDRSAVYVAVAQCGTRAYALEGLARMRLWQAQLEEKARRKAMGEKEEDPPVEPGSCGGGGPDERVRQPGWGLRAVPEGNAGQIRKGDARGEVRRHFLCEGDDGGVRDRGGPAEGHAAGSTEDRP